MDKYMSPQVLDKILSEFEGNILANSVVDQMSGITTSGQSKDDFYDTSVSGSSFNHSWGD